MAGVSHRSLWERRGTRTWVAGQKLLQ